MDQPPRNSVDKSLDTPELVRQDRAMTNTSTTTAQATFTRVTAGWYSLNNLATAIDVIKDAGFWTVRQNGETFCMAENMKSAKATATTLVGK